MGHQAPGVVLGRIVIPIDIIAEVAHLVVTPGHCDGLVACGRMGCRRLHAALVVVSDGLLFAEVVRLAGRLAQFADVA